VLKIFVLLLVKIWSDILLVKEVQISIWGFQMINLQSIHFIYMNNRACFTWENIAYQSRLPVFDQKRFDWACNIGFGYWLLATKKKDICRLKRCLRDFKIRNHQCLFPDLFVIWIDLQNGPSCPSVSGLGSFSLFSLFGFEHHHISYFLWYAQIFWILWIISYT